MPTSFTSKISGVWTAIITPFDSAGGIDWPAFEKLLAKQEEAGVDGVVVCGTTGESPTLTAQEKISLVRKARTALDPKVRVMAGTGSNNTAQSVELSKLAMDAGAESLLVVTPPYNKPSLAGLQGHFSTIAEATQAPLCLYHVPGRTAQMLSVSDLTALTQIPGIVAVKEASAQIDYFSRVNRQSGDCALLSGDDPTYLGSLAVGGQGIISVVTNVFPKAFVALTKAWLRDDTHQALEIHNVLLPFVDSLFWEPNPCPTKAILAEQGLCQNQVRLPLAVVEPSTQGRLKEAFATTQSKLRELGLDG